ncbi:hypothetical protein C483_10746 [Natrialba hulunbeirensis JCM 10989]|uniref:DUF7282 domain-containing protein n=1 Tax=Natrialba hulunbeirensis JCM 10989 TaxID=1227493 RepID=L9ZY63_9EURY|nr:hypothetical protein [Natrialba hulunbeirensis]ELY90532.1 hypothetical protein C483_10746 [Natrialba hulunbeirensis JCM 10989]
MSSRPTFGTIKRVVAILIAITIVLAAGIVVGQAPALFGIDDDPEATIEFEDQQQNGSAVVIDEVTLSDGGYVVITGGTDATEPLAVSDPLSAGTHENLTIERDDDAEQDLLGRLTATVHQNTADEDDFAYAETDGTEDQPYLSAGYPVSATATVTAEEIDDALEDSFAVEDLDAPDSATTNETMEVTAEIRNPTDLDAQQPVELRLDGRVLEWQTLDLEGGESTTVTFEVDTRGTPPGERVLGVYTDRDGIHETIELEFHTEPSVTVTDASDSRVITDVAIPVEGFVAVVEDGGEDDGENGDGDETAENGTDETDADPDDWEIRGASDQLEPGEHEEVRVSFDENVSVDDGDELTAVIYEGDPENREAASPYEPDADEIVVDEEALPELVATTFTVGEESTDAE